MSLSIIRKALLQEGVNGKVRCLICERRCLIAEGERGWCRTRENQAPTLYTLTYGAVSSLSCSPIEKKPLYHFYPGSVALTARSWSCNRAWPELQPHPVPLDGGSDYACPTVGCLARLSHWQIYALAAPEVVPEVAFE